MATRALANRDARVRPADSREDFRVDVEQLVPRDDQDSYPERKVPLAAFQPFWDKVHADHTVPRREPFFDAPDMATTAMELTPDWILVPNGTHSEALAPKILVDLSDQKSIHRGAIVALANRRSGLEAPVDPRAIAEQGLTEPKGKLPLVY